MSILEDRSTRRQDLTKSSEERNEEQQRVLFGKNLHIRYAKEVLTLLKFFPNYYKAQNLLFVSSCSQPSDIISGSVYVCKDVVFYVSGLYNTKCSWNVLDIKEMKKIGDNVIEFILANVYNFSASAKGNPAADEPEFMLQTDQKIVLSFVDRDILYSIFEILQKQPPLFLSNNYEFILFQEKLLSAIYTKENRSIREHFVGIPTSETVMEAFACSLDRFVQGQLLLTNMSNLYYWVKVPFSAVTKYKIELSDVNSINKQGNNIIEISTASTNYSFGFKGTIGSSNVLSVDFAYDILSSAYHHYINRPKVFGVPLTSLVTNEEVPWILKQFVDYITSSELDTEGIFRVSTSKSELARIQSLYDRGVNFHMKEVTLDSFMASDLMKKFFRDLPLPLFTFEFHQCFITVWQTKDLLDEIELLKRIEKLLMQLHPVHQRVVSYLMDFLALVAQHSQKNKMSEHNLATIFAPILFRPQDTSENKINNNSQTTSNNPLEAAALFLAQSELFQDTAHSVELLKLLIIKRDLVFKK